MERYLFDVERFPVVEKAMAWVDFEDREERKEIEKEDIEGEETSVEEKERERERVAKEKRRFSVVDIEEQLRATLNKLIYQAARLDPLPEDCTYTVAVELRDDPSALPPLAVSFHFSVLHKSGLVLRHYLTLSSILSHGSHLNLLWRLVQRVIVKQSGQIWAE